MDPAESESGTDPASDRDPDLEVLSRVAEGDAESFGALVHRHEERIVRLCERMLGGREEARDAAQEVFLKVFRKAGAFRPRARVSTWIYRIAVNHCLNVLRRRKLVRFLSFGALDGGDPDEAPAFDPVDESPSPAERLAARERWERIRGVIDGLPESQRTVLILARFEGLSYREIADVLGTTPGAVDSRLVRAMRKLAAAQESDPPSVAPPGGGRSQP